jgi:hypothetical protein
VKIGFKHIVGAAAIAGGIFLLTKLSDSQTTPQQSAVITGDPSVAKEQEAAIQREGANVSEETIKQRMADTQYQIAVAEAAAQRKAQESIDVGARLAVAAASGASYVGSPGSQTIIHRVRQDGKIYLYDQKGTFLGFEQGATADAYAKKFYGDKQTAATAKKPSKAAVSDYSVAESQSGVSVVKVTPQTRDASGQTSLDKRIKASSRYKGSKYR